MKTKICWDCNKKFKCNNGCNSKLRRCYCKECENKRKKNPNLLTSLFVSHLGLDFTKGVDCYSPKKEKVQFD